MNIHTATAIADFNTAEHNDITEAVLSTDGVVNILVIDKIDAEFTSALSGADQVSVVIPPCTWINEIGSCAICPLNCTGKFNPTVRGLPLSIIAVMVKLV